jgi:hypothetical protein
VPAKDVVIRGAGVLVVAGVLIGGGSYVIQDGGGGDEVTANVFVDDATGSANCVRSASLIEFDAADDVNAVCTDGARTGGDGSVTAWENACWAATAGDVVAVKNGTYTAHNTNGAIMESNHDCSDGSGAAYNPNWEEQGSAQASLANWVRYVPADDPQEINWGGSGNGADVNAKFFQADYHIIFDGIDWRTSIFTNYGGEAPGGRAQNLIFRGTEEDPADVYGIQIIGSKNIMFQHVDIGPSIQCGKDNDANVPDAMECRSDNTEWWEAKFATLGTAEPGCDGDTTSICGGWFAYGGAAWTETYVHEGGAGDYDDIRFEHVINHDQQTRGTGGGFHPGCLFNFLDGGVNTYHNLVLDHYVCERATGATLQLLDSGVTIQNSVFTCQVAVVGQADTPWDDCLVAGSPAGLTCRDYDTGDGDGIGACDTTHLIVRYNAFLAEPGTNALLLPDQTIDGGDFGTHSTTNIIANYFNAAIQCSVPGVTYNANTFANGATTCGTNATSLGSGDPLTDSSITTPGNSYLQTGTALDVTADGSPAFPTLNPTTLNTACSCDHYTLDHDFQDDARSSTSTKPGPDG